MESGEFRTSLFGYSKIDVCDYIARMNKDFSRQIMNYLEDQEKEKKILRDRIIRLEAELKEYKEQHSQVSNAILDAKKYAAQLKEESDCEQEKRRLEFSEWDEEQAQKIQSYWTDISGLRSHLQCLTKNMDTELEKYENRLESLKSHCQNRAKLDREQCLFHAAEDEDSQADSISEPQTEDEPAISDDTQI